MYPAGTRRVEVEPKRGKSAREKRRGIPSDIGFLGAAEEGGVAK
jgi:hypothetical protein